MWSAPFSSTTYSTCGDCFLQAVLSCGPPLPLLPSILPVETVSCRLSCHVVHPFLFFRLFYLWRLFPAGCPVIWSTPFSSTVYSTCGNCFLQAVLSCGLPLPLLPSSLPVETVFCWLSCHVIRPFLFYHLVYMWRLFPAGWHVMWSAPSSSTVYSTCGDSFLQAVLSCGPPFPLLPSILPVGTVSCRLSCHVVHPFLFYHLFYLWGLFSAGCPVMWTAPSSSTVYSTCGDCFLQAVLSCGPFLFYRLFYLWRLFPAGCPVMWSTSFSSTVYSTCGDCFLQAGMSCGPPLPLLPSILPVETVSCRLSCHVVHPFLFFRLFYLWRLFPAGCPVMWSTPFSSTVYSTCGDCFLQAVLSCGPPLSLLPSILSVETVSCRLSCHVVHPFLFYHLFYLWRLFPAGCPVMWSASFSSTVYSTCGDCFLQAGMSCGLPLSLLPSILPVETVSCRLSCHVVHPFLFYHLFYLWRLFPAGCPVMWSAPSSSTVYSTCGDCFLQAVLSCGLPLSLLPSSLPVETVSCRLSCHVVRPFLFYRLFYLWRLFPAGWHVMGFTPSSSTIYSTYGDCFLQAVLSCGPGS